MKTSLIFDSTLILVYNNDFSFCSLNKSSFIHPFYSEENIKHKIYNHKILSILILMMLQQYIIYMKEFNDKIKNGRRKGKHLMFCKVIDGSYKI